MSHHVSNQCKVHINTPPGRSRLIFLLLLCIYSIVALLNCIITFECLLLAEAKTSSIDVEVEAFIGRNDSSMLSNVSKTKLCSP